MMFDFVDGAAGNETGDGLNRSALSEIRLQPRVLMNVENRSLKTFTLGREWNLPFGIAPMGMCNLTWPRADRFLAVEAARSNIPFCMSCAASTTMEDITLWTRDQSWFQLYLMQAPEAALKMADRAAAAGIDVLVLTVDVPQVSRRIRDLQNGFQVPFHFGPKQILDFALHPRWSLETLFRGVPKPANYATGNGSNDFARSASRAGADWAFLDQLRQRWKGKLVVKGVMSPTDAVRIRDAGADAVYVSNHGGRQLDSAPAAIHALPRIRQAVGADFPLIFDSGVRTGEDIVKALALGADFVMLGRPIMYAIGADGARGLASLVEILAEEINVTLAQIGVRRIEDIDGRNIAPSPSATGEADCFHGAAERAKVSLEE